jgi:hypothetical protein
MRRRVGLASFLSLVLLPWTASAQEADVSAAVDPDAEGAPNQVVLYGAMPGGLNVASADVIPKGAVQVSMLSGYGRRSGLLDPDHSFNRTLGGLAFAYGVHEKFSIGLTLDGRYDKHSGLMPGGDDGYVGDPRLLARFATGSGGTKVGAQLGIWVPGKDAPSVAGSAISVDARGIVSLAAGPGTLSFNAGFRLDNSAKSVDEVTRLSLEDRVSLGVSEYNAVFGGAHLMFPAGKAWVALEGSAEAFLGSAPAGSAELKRGSLIARGGASAGFHISDTLSAALFVQAAKVPGVQLSQVMNANIPLVPYEPIVTVGLGLQARFGGPKGAAPTFVEKDCAKRNPPDCPAVKVPLLAEVSGSVVDANGKPVVGARVTLKLKNSQVDPVATDDKGVYVFKGVRIGTSTDNVPELDESGVEVGVEVSSMKPGTATLTAVEQGANTVPPITLEPLLPPGQLRGVVRSLPGGKAVTGATITVTPGDGTASTAADGTFSLDLAPGQYRIKVEAAGLKPQELDVTIDPNGVAIKNIDLFK